jgi:hypothetical protein
MKMTVVLVNSLLAGIVVFTFYQSYSAEGSLAHHLGNPSVGVMVYAASHLQEFLLKLLFVAVLAGGAFLEVRKSKGAAFVNLGLPLCLSVIILADCAVSWGRNPQEVETTLVLVALPLLAVLLLYLRLYWEDLRSTFHRDLGGGPP